MESSTNYSLSDIVAAVKGGGGSSGGGLSGMEGLVWVVVLLALLGNGGLGGLGGGSAAARAATAEDVAAQTFTTKMDGITNGISNLGYTLGQQFADANMGMTNGFNAVQSALCQGFSGVNAAISSAAAAQAMAQTQGFAGLERGLCDVNNNLTQQMTALSHQISDCCCEMKTMQLQSQLDAANARNAELAAQISNDRQTQTLINTFGRFVTNPPCPQPEQRYCQPAQRSCSCDGFAA